MNWFLIALFVSNSFSKNVQEVDFSGAEINGKSRAPDASLISDGRAAQFNPIYRTRNGFRDRLHRLGLQVRPNPKTLNEAPNEK